MFCRDRRFSASWRIAVREAVAGRWARGRPRHRRTRRCCGRVSVDRSARPSGTGVSAPSSGAPRVWGRALSAVGPWALERPSSSGVPRDTARRWPFLHASRSRPGVQLRRSLHAAGPRTGRPGALGGEGHARVCAGPPTAGSGPGAGRGPEARLPGARLPSALRTHFESFQFGRSDRNAADSSGREHPAPETLARVAPRGPLTGAVSAVRS